MAKNCDLVVWVFLCQSGNKETGWGKGRTGWYCHTKTTAPSFPLSSCFSQLPLGQHLLKESFITFCMIRPALHLSAPALFSILLMHGFLVRVGTGQVPPSFHCIWALRWQNRQDKGLHLAKCRCLSYEHLPLPYELLERARGFAGTQFIWILNRSGG